MKCSAVVGNRNHVFGSRAQWTMQPCMFWISTSDCNSIPFVLSLSLILKKERFDFLMLHILITWSSSFSKCKIICCEIFLDCLKKRKKWGKSVGKEKEMVLTSIRKSTVSLMEGDRVKRADLVTLARGTPPKWCRCGSVWNINTYQSEQRATPAVAVGQRWGRSNSPRSSGKLSQSVVQVKIKRDRGRERKRERRCRLRSVRVNQVRMMRINNEEISFISDLFLLFIA